MYLGVAPLRLQLHLQLQHPPRATRQTKASMGIIAAVLAGTKTGGRSRLCQQQPPWECWTFSDIGSRNMPKISSPIKDWRTWRSSSLRTSFTALIFSQLSIKQPANFSDWSRRKSQKVTRWTSRNCYLHLLYVYSTCR